MVGRAVDIPDPLAPPAFVAGHHAVSPFNFSRDVQATYEFARPFHIVDSTLRKILKTTGLQPSVPSLLRVAEALHEVGIRDMIMNVSWWGEPEPAPIEYEAFRAVMRQGLGFAVTVYSDALAPSDLYEQRYPAPLDEVLTRLAEVGSPTIALDVPWHPADSTDLAEERRERFGAVVQATQKHGLQFGLHVADPARMPFAGLVGALNRGLGAGATRIDISDSYSSLSPEAMKLFVRTLRSSLERDVPISMHTHNDFGLASAGAIAAATAGALPDCAVNGLSYRSGFAALEEVVVALELLYGVKTGIQMERLQWLSDLVEEATGFPRHPLKPITGRHAYLRDHPMWMLAYLEGGFPPSASCYEPAIVGGRMRMVWTVHPGNEVIRRKLSQMGLEVDEPTVRKVRGQIDERLAEKHGYPYWVDEDEIEEICRKVTKG